MTLKEKYTTLANNYLMALAQILEVDQNLAIWENSPGGIASIGGFLNIGYYDIRKAVDNGWTRGKFSAWYDSSHGPDIDFKKVTKFKGGKYWGKK